MPSNEQDTKKTSLKESSGLGATLGATVPAATAASGHCPYRASTLLQQSLEPGKMRVAFLLGAGCPVAIRVPNGPGSSPLIPDTAGLTAQVRESLMKSAEHAGPFASVLQRLADLGQPEPNVEAILSLVRVLRDVVGNTNYDGLSTAALKKLDTEICRVIRGLVEVRLSSDDTPYHRLATWIKGIQRDHPVEIFTPNYDLLMEQGLEDRAVPYFDGFVGSDRTFFDLASIELDPLPARWARLWKVHGSINWRQTANGSIERRKPTDEGDRLLIYPSEQKYSESRRMPYLAMQDRLRGFLARGQAVLVTCGYSFSDQHLNDVILLGLNGNPNAICFGLLHGNRAKAPEAVNRARGQANFNLFAADGAVIGTVERAWLATERPEHPLHGVAVLTGDKGAGADPQPCRSTLGDFKALGAFFAQQLTARGEPS
jgi:hypothetical protein